VRAVRAAARWLVALLALLVGRARERPSGTSGGRLVAPPPGGGGAVGLAAVLLFGSALAFAGFGAAYVLDLGTRLLGGTLAVAFGLAAAASIIAGKRIVAQEEEEEELGSRDHLEARAQAAEMIREGGEGVSRRGLLVAAGCAGCAAAAALALPAASLGPVLDTDRLRNTPWRAGRRLVDAEGAPILADDIALGSFVTAYPEGAETNSLDSPVIVARVRPDELRLPPGRQDWAPDGMLAYSKICTHAACAISLFDYPSFERTQPSPRLVCPCHYSVFDAVGGGGVLAGPAGRPLPQLPVAIREDRTLVAGGRLSGAPGPSWGGVREP
jgi:ubiquinol-cytochrome c reductase iron-sulfur subunit